MTLRNAFGELSLETTQQGILQELQTQQKNALTDDELRASPVPVNTGLIQGTTPADTQPVSISTLPLPNGAATEATLVQVNSNLGTDGSTPPTIAGTGIRGWLRGIYEKLSGNFTVTGPLTNSELRASPVNVNTGLAQGTTPADTQPISATTLPLPNGAATSAKQLPDNHQVTVSNFPVVQTVTGSVEIANDVGNPIPVSGTISATQNGPWDTRNITGTISLPTGAATSAKQLPDNHQVQVSNFPNTQNVSGTVEIANDVGNPIPVSATTLPLPVGAATEATLAGVRSDLGTDGAAPPVISGTGVRGWLRAIYEKLIGSIKVSGAHTISVVNSTTTPLGSNASFIGQWENVENYVAIQCVVNSDHLANTDNVVFEFSTDGINIDRAVPITFQTGGDYASLPCKSKFFRLRVVNGGPAQSYLRVQTQYNAVAPGSKLVPFGDEVTLSSSALLTRGGIIGRSSQGGGTFYDVKVDPAGKLLADVSGSTVTSNGLTNSELRNSPVGVKDELLTIEHTTDVTGTGTVVNFNLTQTAEFVMVDVDNTSSTDNNTYRVRVTIDGQTPTSTFGFVCRSGQTTYIPVNMTGTIVKAFIPTGVVVAVQAANR